MARVKPMTKKGRREPPVSIPLGEAITRIREKVELRIGLSTAEANHWLAYALTRATPAGHVVEYIRRRLAARGTGAEKGKSHERHG